MRKARIVFVGLLLPIFAFVGCSEELKSPQVETDARVSRLSNQQVDVSVSGMEQPNAYEVLMKWPEAQGTIRISERSQIVAVVAGSEKKLVIKNATGGSELSYLFEQLTVDGRVSASIPVFVKIPKDVLWDGPVALTDHQKVDANRLFLTSKAVVVTNDKNLTIVVKEFISDGGTIQNFAEEAAAAFEKNGRSGGTVSIVSEKARGSLQVFLRGEGGGHGRNGAITFPGRHPGCAGTTGGNGGNAGNLNVNVADGSLLNISYNNKEGKKGIAGVRGSVAGGPITEVVYPPCDADSPNGGDGIAGTKGQVCLKLAAEQEHACH